MARNKINLPSNNEMVKRSYGLIDLRAEDDGTFIEGHPAVYDQKVDIGGWFYEVIERGAFDQCDFDDVLFSVNHNLEMIPLARSRRNNINSTMQIGLDDKGVKVKANLDIENNAESKSLYSSVKRGDIDGMSFIFYVQDAWWENLDTEMPTRHITKIRKVREVSAVTFPAYSNTDINARDQEAVDTAKMVLDNARSELDNSKGELEILKLKNQILLKG